MTSKQVIYWPNFVTRRRRNIRIPNWILCSAWKKWIGGTPLEHLPCSPDLAPHAISGLFQPWKGSSEARNFEVIYGLQQVFEKWVQRCKKCIVFKGGTSKKRPSPHLHKVPTRSNKVCPRTLQTALVLQIMNTTRHDSDVTNRPMSIPFRETASPHWKLNTAI
jgi:hypothetical protein